MAAIEKICEFSGEYPGPVMYKYKRNFIQIKPEHRKAFRKHEAVLVIFKPSLEKKYTSFLWNIPVFWRLLRLLQIGRIIPGFNFEYKYALLVPDVLGRVGGAYFNYCTGKYSYLFVIIKIWFKLLRGSFGIEHLPDTLEEYQNYETNTGKSMKDLKEALIERFFVRDNDNEKEKENVNETS